jgi:myo-inositol-1(or 4)-monophosphatase
LPDAEQVLGDPSITASLAECVREAGMLAFGKFRSSFKSWTKDASSPVSEVDIAVNDLLRERLSRIDARAAWLSEESADDPQRTGAERVWIVDPIDGTRAFIAGLTDWAVSVALVQGGRPLAAALFAPAEDTFYLATAGRGATRNGAMLQAPDAPDLAAARISGPKRRVDTIARFAPEVVALPRVNSLALRIAHVSDGVLDVAFAGGNSHDWDLAAADLILQESGALLTDFAGRTVTYNRPDPVHGALVAAGRGRHLMLLDLFAREPAAFA